MTVALTWRGSVANGELNALHAEGFGHTEFDDDWEGQLARHSLGWVVARDGVELVGFVNVAWDGGVHALLLDTVVAVSHRGRSPGRALVQTAVEGASEAGCEWFHVDWDRDLDRFYLGACGFTPTPAGLRSLRCLEARTPQGWRARVRCSPVVKDVDPCSAVLPMGWRLSNQLLPVRRRTTAITTQRAAAGTPASSGAATASGVARKTNSAPTSATRTTVVARVAAMPR